MKRESEVVGLPVINKLDGSKIATIKKVIYSKNKFRILAFLVEESSFFKEAKIIEYKNIDKIGIDAVMVSSRNIIIKADTIPEIDTLLKNKQEIMGEQVLTENGESIGWIQDIVFDHDSGKIFGFMLTDGIIQDIKDGRNVLPYIKGIKFGDEALIIDDNIKGQFDRNKENFKKLLELE
ncbi:PRC-barrel domain-containing protein [Dethiothermospora halolimnae]|uniref:PRC-barrel domain-containing protein n=1 Tax=Dethiothermospora halolimnae TaxID=3114390 RepID=UPI003CCBEF63